MAPLRQYCRNQLDKREFLASPGLQVPFVTYRLHLDGLLLSIAYYQ